MPAAAGERGEARGGSRLRGRAHASQPPAHRALAGSILGASSRGAIACRTPLGGALLGVALVAHPQGVLDLRRGDGQASVARVSLGQGCQQPRGFAPTLTRLLANLLHADRRLAG